MIQIDNVKKEVRYVRRKRVGEDGVEVWDRFKLADVVNTEVCEQTFSIFVKFKAAFRAMDKDTSELFITRMSIVHNEEITLVLMKKKHNPTPGVEHFTPREKVAVHEHPFFTGRVYAD